jgi:hypothetical protein
MEVNLAESFSASPALWTQHLREQRADSDSDESVGPFSSRLAPLQECTAAPHFGPVREDDSRIEFSAAHESVRLCRDAPGYVFVPVTLSHVALEMQIMVCRHNSGY